MIVELKICSEVGISWLQVSDRNAAGQQDFLHTIDCVVFSAVGGLTKRDEE